MDYQSLTNHGDRGDEVEDQDRTRCGSRVVARRLRIGDVKTVIFPTIVVSDITVVCIYQSTVINVSHIEERHIWRSHSFCYL